MQIIDKQSISVQGPCFGVFVEYNIESHIDPTTELFIEAFIFKGKGKWESLGNARREGGISSDPEGKTLTKGSLELSMGNAIEEDGKFLRYEAPWKSPRIKVILSSFGKVDSSILSVIPLTNHGIN